MSMRIDTFKGALGGGGARPNLFRVTLGFPSGASGALATGLGAVGGAIGGAVGGVVGAVSNVLGGGGPSRKLQFLCKAASLPAQSIGVISIPFRGRQLKIAGDRTFAEWSITIINDTDFSIRNAFEEWSNLINAHVANVGPSSLYSYTQQAQVEQLTREGPSLNPTSLKTYLFEECWPSEIAAIALNYETGDAIEEFEVSLQYQYWTSNTTS
ncbi:unnamed protein product [marine sediment metagenome]|uniref:Tail tube protein n=1 Tax=marine sediment metagenome TaxID=412755 RepID=X0TC47_9ZZZZ